MKNNVLMSYRIVYVMFTEMTKLIMSVCSRLSLNMAANIGLQYAAELLPTPARSQGVGMIHIFGILGHAIAPYVTDTVSSI